MVPASPLRAWPLRAWPLRAWPLRAWPLRAWPLRAWLAGLALAALLGDRAHAAPVEYFAIPDCEGTSHLTYTAATLTFGCASGSGEEKTWGMSWNSNLTVQTGTYPLAHTQVTSLVIDSVFTTMSGAGFTVEITAAGTPVGGCAGIGVGGDATTACTSGNTLSAGADVAVVVTATAGPSNTALVQVNWHVVTP